jgi:IclR family transcriptional regulator, KDG regulon repressor
MARVVPAVARGLDILELFLGVDDTLSAPEVAGRLQLPRTTVHELIATLVARGYLVAAAPASNRYRLGVRVAQLGNRYGAGLDLARVGQDVCAEVAGACDETVHLAVLEGREVVYIAKIDSTRTVRMVSAVGRRLPAHCTSVGKMLLARLPPAELDQLYPPKAELEAMTAHSITSRPALLDALATARRRGVAYDDRESNPDVGCVAAPVSDGAGGAVAALSISVPTTRWNAVTRKACERLARDGAARLAERLGN